MVNFMILTKKTLFEYLTYEKKLYINPKNIDNVVSFICKDYVYCIWTFIRALRYSEYHLNNSSLKMGKRSVSSTIHDVKFVLWRHKKNRIGRNLNIEIFENCFEKGLHIYHCAGGIVVNGYAKIGKNCKLHGNNCIGNIDSNERVPVIGDNVDMGYGSMIIGGITVGNNIKIAANAVVVKTFTEDGIVLAGIPAQIIKR